MILSEALGNLRVTPTYMRSLNKKIHYLLKFLHQLKPELSLTPITCDFDQAIIKSVIIEYPNAEMYVVFIV